MVKEFYGNVEVRLCLVWPENYKICFLCVYWLLLLASSNSSQHREGSCQRHTEGNSKTKWTQYRTLWNNTGPNVSSRDVLADL